MNRKLIKISTAKMSREEWVEARRSTIGGSDAAAIANMSPWSSPYSVWANKLGMTPDAEDNEAMRQGRDLEDYVAKRFCEVTGKRVRRENNILIDPEFPVAHANVDRLVIGEDAGLECKTTSTLNLKKFANGEFPENYYVQCVHYMMVTGAKRWYLAVLVFGRGFYWYTIERDEEEITALRNIEAEFSEYLRTHEPPPADGKDATTDALGEVFPEDDGSEVDVSMYEAEIETILALKDRKKEIDKLLKEKENVIKEYMGAASVGLTDGHKVTWKAISRSTFDTAAFAEDHPEIDLSEYYKTTTARTFKIA